MKNYSILVLIAIMHLFTLTAYSQGNHAREEANINEVYNEFGLSGEGVVMVIIDRGIDYYHPDFIKENGKTRILYLYDMINPQGANDP